MLAPVSAPYEQQPHLVPGYRLDRYELLVPIGAGGMASVWVARMVGKHGFERLVAIKTILPAYARDPRFQGMFLDEARIASRIQHPNVAQILDLGDTDGILFLAMEWIEGDALSKLARAVHDGKLTFPPNLALRILSDVCAGLHAAHELRDRGGALLGIVHRDVSPQNILIGDQGVSKVIDFGIAKARDRVGGDTETGSFKGKVRFMAPEQALSPRSTDRRADVWAAGAILYFLLSGRSPYQGENDVATIAQLASRRSPLPLPAYVPAPIRAIANRALAWAPDERYATADEMRVALEDAMLEARISATPGDVATFLARHLGERLETRKQAVAIALSEADERSRVQRRSVRLPAAADARGAPRPSANPTAVLSASLERGAATSPTLGTAATMTTSSIVLATGKRRGVLAALACAGLAAGVAVVLALAHRHEEAPPPAAAAPAPAQVAPRPIAAVVPTAPPTTVATAPAVSAPTAAEAPAPATSAARAPGAPVAAPPTPSVERRPPPRAATTNRESPAPTATVKPRAEYGF